MKTLLLQLLSGPLVRYPFDPAKHKSDLSDEQAEQGAVGQREIHSLSAQSHAPSDNKLAASSAQSQSPPEHDSSTTAANQSQVCPDGADLQTQSGPSNTASPASPLPLLTSRKRLIKGFPNANVQGVYHEFTLIHEFDYRLTEFVLILYEIQCRQRLLRDLCLYQQPGIEYVEGLDTEAIGSVIKSRQTPHYPVLTDLLCTPRRRMFCRPIDSYFAINCLLYHDYPLVETLQTPFLQSLQHQSLVSMKIIVEKREMAANLRQRMLSLTTGNFKLSIMCRHDSPIIGKLFGSGLQKYMLPRTQLLSTSGKQGNSNASRYTNLPDFAFTAYTDELINSLIYMYLRQFENVYTVEDARKKRIFLSPAFLTLLFEITRYELHVMSRLGVDPNITLESSSARNSVEAHEISATLDSILSKTNMVDIDALYNVDYSYIFYNDAFMDSIYSKNVGPEEANAAIEKLVESHPSFTVKHKALLYQAELGLKLIDLILRNNSYEGNLHFEQRLYDQVHIQYPTELTAQPVSIQHGRLKNYQLDGVKFLVSLYRSSGANLQDIQSGVGSSGCLLADDMGCGKTAQSIAFLAYLSDNRISTGMHLIISPLAVSDSWASEFRTWFPNFSVLLYKGDQEQRARYRRHILSLSKGNMSLLTDYSGSNSKEKEAWANTDPNAYSPDSGKGKSQIFSTINAIVTTYEYAIKDRSFFKQIDFDVLIVDEASRVKNARGKLIDVLKKNITCRFRVLLSGTPIQNNLRELFTLLGLIHPAVFCDYDRFANIFGQVFVLSHGYSTGRHHHRAHHTQNTSGSNGDKDMLSNSNIFNINTTASSTLDSTLTTDTKAAAAGTIEKRSKRNTAGSTVTFADEIGDGNISDELGSSYSYSEAESGEEDNVSEMSRISSMTTDMMVPIESTTSLIGARTTASMHENSPSQVQHGLSLQNTVITVDNVADVAIQLAEDLSKNTSLTNSQKTFIIERLHGILKPFLLRRIKTEVLAQLPPKEEIIIRVPLSAFQLFFYNLAIANGRALTNPELASSLPANFIRNLDIYLRCVCNHPFTALENDKLQILYNFYLMKGKAFSARHKKENTDFYNQIITKKEGSAPESDASGLATLEHMYVNDQIWRISGKLEILDNILTKLHKTSHRVLIFSQFKKVLDVLATYLRYRQYRFVRFDGSVKDVDRSNMIRGYNKEDSKEFIFLLSTRAASHGLNLQTADTVIIFDCDYNGTYDQQAQDRCYRLGQVNPVKVFKLYSNTAIESKMLSVANSKMSLATIVMDAGTYTANVNDRNNTQTMEVMGTDTRKRKKMSTQEYILEVLSAKSAVPDNVHIPTPEEINKYLARSDREFQAFQLYDIETGLFWKKRNFNEDIPRLDPEIPSVFLEQKDQIYKEMREMNLLDDKQDVVMPTMQVSSSGDTVSRRAVQNNETSEEQTTSEYNEDDDSESEEMISETQESEENTRRGTTPKLTKSSNSIKKSLSKILSGPDLMETLYSRIYMMLDKSAQSDVELRNSIIFSSSIIQKTSVVLTPIIDKVFLSFLSNYGTTCGVLLLISTIVGLADLIQQQDVYGLLGIQAMHYLTSEVSPIFACFYNQELSAESEKLSDLANRLTAISLTPEIKTAMSPGTKSYLGPFMFPENSMSLLKEAYLPLIAEQSSSISAFHLLYTRSVLFFMSLKIHRVTFNFDLLSYLNNNITSQKRPCESTYSDLLCYFSCGLAINNICSIIPPANALYGKSNEENAQDTPSDSGHPLFSESKPYTGIYVRLHNLPHLSKELQDLSSGFRYYASMSQSSQTIASYPQYLELLLKHLQCNTVVETAPLPVYVRINVNQQRLLYIYRSARTSGITTDIAQLLGALIEFHLRLMAIFNYLIHLIDPLCMYADVSSDIDNTSEEVNPAFPTLPYRILSQFWLLPERKDLPSYYQVIPFPKPFAMIYDKLITLSYMSLHEFVADIRQSFKNSLQFNDRNSPFCEHARVCNELTLQQVAQHFQYCNAETVLTWFSSYERRLSVIKRGYTLLPTFLGCGIYEFLKSETQTAQSSSQLTIELTRPSGTGLVLLYGAGISMPSICAYDILRYSVALSQVKKDVNKVPIEDAARHSHVKK